MKSTLMKNVISLIVLLGVIFFALGCGDGDDSGSDGWCPGVICTNCATDCPDLDCPAGQMDSCVGGAYFDADESLRCEFCQ